MAAASGIRAGKAYVELFVKNDATKALQKVADQLKGIGTSIAKVGAKAAVLGAGIVASLVGVGVAFAGYGATIDDASARTGVAADKLQELKYAAEQSGASFEDVESGIRKMQKAIVDAATGSEEAEANLKAIGLSAAELVNLSPDEQFKKIADGIASINDPAARVSVGMGLMGKGAASLLPLLSEGAAGINALGQEAHDLGLILDKDAIAAAAKFDDTVAKLTSQGRALMNQIGAAVVNAIQPFADALTKCAATVIQFVKTNRNLVIGVLAGGAALAAAGVAVVGLGFVFLSAGAIISGTVAVFATVASAIGFLIGPIGLVGGALVALAGYFLTSSDVGAQAFDFLKQKFGELAKSAMTTFNGIADALRAGDVGLAAKILWTGLKVIWAQGTYELTKKWIEFKTATLKFAVEAFYGVLDAYAIVKASLQSAFAQTTAFFVDAWHKAVDETTNILTRFWDEQAKETERNRIARDVAAGKITQEQGNQQLSNVENQANQVDAARRQKADEAARQREAELQKRLSEIEQQKKDALTKNVDAERALKEGLKVAADNEVAELNKEKAALEKQLAELRRRAGASKDLTAGTEDRLKDLKDRLKKLTGRDFEDVAAAKQSVSVKAAGTTNAFAVAGLGGGTVSVQEDIKKATEETARATKAIEKQGKPKFR